MSQLTFALAGASFRDVEAKTVTRALERGAGVTFSPDPTNPYDATAVKVLRNETFIGYVPAAQNLELFLFLQSGKPSPTGIVLTSGGKLKPTIEVVF